MFSKIKTIVYTTEKDHEWLKKHEAEIVETMMTAKNVEVEPFVYRYVEVTPVTEITNEDGTSNPIGGKVRINHQWFDRTFTGAARAEGFNNVAFHFTRADRKKWGLSSTINGTYWRDTDKEWEFWVCADKGQKSDRKQTNDRLLTQYVRVFIHEMGHGFMHFWHDARREEVHDYDYNKKNIKSLFSTMVAPIPAGFDGLPMNSQYALPHFWTGNNPRSIMLHTTGGRGVLGAVETLRARGLSYNYLIDEVGEIYELVHYSNSAWHAGVIKNPNQRSQVFYGTLKDKENPNRNSVGIAYTYPLANVGVLSDRMIDSTIKLMKAIGTETGIRYTADNIFAHVEVTSDKPQIVLGYRNQVVEAIVGDKDGKDAEEKKRLTLLIQFLKLKIKYLLLLKGLRK